MSLLKCGVIMKKLFSIFDEEIPSFRKIDFFIVFLILLFYGTLSFFRLGDLRGPNTFYRLNKSEEIIFEFNDEEEIIRMKYFNGEKNSKFRMYISSDNEVYEYLMTVNPNGVFTWNDIHIAKDAKYVKFVMKEDSSFGEVAFYEAGKQLLEYSSNNQYLSDEQEMVPDKISYMNSMYFDEIYFARTAYEIVNGLPQYEWTHPPLGKIIQAVPIYITHSFSPFLYRFMGNIAGILLVLIMYPFGALLFRKRGYALLSSLFMMLDTFHFAHTRMGTVDSYLVLFIVLAAMFMFLYISKDKNYFLFLSGLFFGLSVCVKWTGFYGGLGLAIIYFVHFIKNKNDLLESIVKGSVFFVVIPITLYCSIYFLFSNNLHRTNSISAIVEEQKSMYHYHSTLNATHFFSSSWYTWPVSYKPVWYHEQVYIDGTKESISGVGNIVLWIGGIFGGVFSFLKLILKRDKNSFFLLIFVFSLWLPYVFIGRVMFLYHYFPVLPFLFLLLVSFLKDITEHFHLKYLIPIYLLCVLLFFVVYYPVVSGMRVPTVYTDALRLFDSWWF